MQESVYIQQPKLGSKINSQEGIKASYSFDGLMGGENPQAGLILYLWCNWFVPDKSVLTLYKTS